MSLPRWSLDPLYAGPADPKLAADLAELEARAKSFKATFSGHLKDKLADALRAYADLEQRSGTLFAYLFMAGSAALEDEQIKNVKADAERRWSKCAADSLTFFEHELVAVDDADVERQAAADPFLAKHLPLVRHLREQKPYLLPERVEQSLAKRSPFGAGSWSDFYDDVEGDLRFPFRGEDKTLTEMLEIMAHDPDRATRAEALKVTNGGLGGSFLKFSSQTLNMVVGGKAVEDDERGYAHPMAAQNRSNRVPDAVVGALHEAVRTHAAPLAQRWYRLKARLLGVERLAWSDRNAALPFASHEKVPYDVALADTVSAYRSFSPTLAGLVERLAAERRIDVPAQKGKQSGAYNLSLVRPDGTPDTFVFLNFQGSPHDVMTLAHEVGHACHGLLAGEAQGVLQQHAPIAYAETASVFGEMTTFNAFLAKVRAGGDAKATLALVGSKIDDVLNTAVRQIGFSLFEQRVHGAKRRLSPDELCDIWMESTAELYGKDGDVFDYRDMRNLWCYVAHFHRPFYVYGYAFGELLTQSLYAARPKLGDKFEPLYLELLRSGSTKDASQLLAPFGLDPASASFWKDGIDVGIGSLVEEAERLAQEI
jgi:oligoendopeptidase F